MARTKHVASFPSTYHETEEWYLPGMTPRGNGWQIWHRATYKDKMQGNKAWSFVLVSILPGLDGGTYLDVVRATSQSSMALRFLQGGSKVY